MKNLLRKMRKKIFTGLAISMVLLITPSFKAFAYDTMGNHVLIGGVGNYGSNNRSFYITSSASGYSTEIRNAMHDWIYTTSRLGISTPISFVETSTQSASVMDVYSGIYPYYPYTNTNAWTEFWANSVAISPESQNWVWNKIYINSYYTSAYSSTVKKGVIAHEMGHCFGLDHTSYKYVIMCTMGDGRAVTESQPDDLDGVNFLY